MFALALGNIYTFGPTFRAENSNTTRHASEFWMIEPEMAFHDLADDARLAQDFLQFIIAQVLEHCPEDMAFFDQWVKPGIVARLEELTRTSFETIPYTEAVRLLERSGQAFQFPVSWGMDLQTEHERWLTETHVGRPVFVIDYPKEIKAFYMRQNDDGRTVAAMDLLVPGVGEIIGGSQREERHDLLLARIREMGLPEADYWWYLESRRFGSAPHAGFGLGFERAIMYVTGMENIRDVVPFPRTPGNCDF
jgi:asparaginyl-tRNA synthetase